MSILLRRYRAHRIAFAYIGIGGWRGRWLALLETLRLR